jgi:hypothetical protein
MASSSQSPDRLTPDLLRQLPDHDLPFVVMEYVLNQIGNDVERSSEILAQQKPHLRALHGALLLDNEVQNGGFNQFFWNHSNQQVIHALDGLEFLGAADHAALLREAMNAAVNQRDQLLPYRLEGTARAFSGSYREGIFDELDKRYYALPQLGDLIAHMIREHPERFCPG